MRHVVVLTLLLTVLASGQIIRVTSDTAQDINPSGGNDVTLSFWVVWQTDRNGNWDIYGCGRPWPAWPDTFPRPVCIDSVDDLHPVVVGSDWYSSSWCIWERREGNFVSTIWAAQDTGDNLAVGWLPPVQIGRVVNTSGDSAFPSACCQWESNRGRPWVVWAGQDTSGSAIYYTQFDGDSWRAPAIVRTSASPLHHPRIGRGRSGLWESHPLLVWEENGDILVSRYRDSVWTDPESVASSPAYDCEPEVASFCDIASPEHGPFIVWQSHRDGDTAVYVTAPDSFAAGFRMCESSAAGANKGPVASMTTSQGRWGLPMAAWVSDRGGSQDIYTADILWPWIEDRCVDPNPASDLNPSVSSYATTGGPNWAWFFWQSDRTGNWDIWAMVVPGAGIEETMNDERVARNAWPTILPGVSGVKRPASLTIFDAMGRRVEDPKPGVYFVRDEGQGARDVGQTRKVVIQR